MENDKFRQNLSAWSKSAGRALRLNGRWLRPQVDRANHEPIPATRTSCQGLKAVHELAVPESGIKLALRLSPARWSGYKSQGVPKNARLAWKCSYERHTTKRF